VHRQSADGETTAVANDWNFDCASNASDMQMLVRNWLLESSGASSLPDANCVVKLDASGLALGAGLNAWATLEQQAARSETQCSGFRTQTYGSDD